MSCRRWRACVRSDSTFFSSAVASASLAPPVITAVMRSGSCAASAWNARSYSANEDSSDDDMGVVRDCVSW